MWYIMKLNSGPKRPAGSAFFRESGRPSIQKQVFEEKQASVHPLQSPVFLYNNIRTERISENHETPGEKRSFADKVLFRILLLSRKRNNSGEFRNMA